MNAYFIDTNVLIYGFSSDEPIKSHIANKLIFDGDGIISLQVVNEFSNICLRKFRKDPSTVIEAVNEVYSKIRVVNFSVSTQIKALELCQCVNVSFYDALILATALQNKCSIVYSEDMQHGQIIEHTLTITNPFFACS
ncbi:PIN domain-containing protein [Desulfonatronum thioautotrophicum]|uniref:PIN domain-containing protein n=1 Tax=Desulfonatronum thioautotrophicum TaxID=617001 RepID=UPI0005EBE26B|nr:PIN domain-containing protein [Desulfonatronum thioautotrophicum]